MKVKLESDASFSFSQWSQSSQVRSVSFAEASKSCSAHHQRISEARCHSYQRSGVAQEARASDAAAREFDEEYFRDN